MRSDATDSTCFNVRRKKVFARKSSFGSSLNGIEGSIAAQANAAQPKAEKYSTSKPYPSPDCQSLPSQYLATTVDRSHFGPSISISCVARRHATFVPRCDVDGLSGRRIPSCGLRDFGLARAGGCTRATPSSTCWSRRCWMETSSNGRAARSAIPNGQSCSP